MSKYTSAIHPLQALTDKINDLENTIQAMRTTQIQGASAIQIAYTADHVLHWLVAPADIGDGTGLIGTFVFTLEYDAPLPESTVFGDMDIQVNQDVDDDLHHLDFYENGLRLVQINDGWLVDVYHNLLGYWPAVKIIKLYTTSPSATPTDFYIHSRWRYVGVGQTLVPVTAGSIIIPDGPTE